MYILIDCQEEFSVGYGYKAEIRYYYEHGAHICNIFPYLGYGGTLNNFKTKAECIETCINNTNVKT